MTPSPPPDCLPVRSVPGEERQSSPEGLDKPQLLFLNLYFCNSIYLISRLNTLLKGRPSVSGPGAGCLLRGDDVFVLTKLLARPHSTSASYLAKRNSTRSRDSERGEGVRDPAPHLQHLFAIAPLPFHHNESHPCQTQPATIRWTDAAREIQEEITERLHHQHERARWPRSRRAHVEECLNSTAGTARNGFHRPV